MCVIVALDADKVVDEETLRNCWVANDDGAGFMYALDNELHMHKGFMTWEDFIQAWRTIPSSVPRVIHFRIKTHGVSDELNTHPFLVNYRLGFVHNGVISGVSNKTKHMNDTWHFNEEFLKPMSRIDGKFLEREFNMKLIRNYIGGSKLVFLNHKGHLTFVNKSMGVQKEPGIWFSNRSFEVKKVGHPASFSHHWMTGNASRSPSKVPTRLDWLLEGSYARLKVDMPQKGLKKGELVYVNNILGSSLEVIVHVVKDDSILEKKWWVNQRDVEEPDYMQEDSFTNWSY